MGYPEQGVAAKPPQTENNIAETIVRELPKPQPMFTQRGDTGGELNTIEHIAMPKGYTVHTIDNEHMLASPRRIKSTAALETAEAFVAFVKRHKLVDSVVWCNFDPETSSLGFTAVFDEHGPAATPGWRKHQAKFTPPLSPEWKTWFGGDKSIKAQLEFATFIEEHIDDIVAEDGYPSSAQMLAMALGFEARSEMVYKSSARLDNGDVALVYEDQSDAATKGRMELFKQFMLGVPVFRDGPAYKVRAKLRYRVDGGKLRFWYELERPDRVHAAAARDILSAIESQLTGVVPVIRGAAS